MELQQRLGHGLQRLGEQRRIGVDGQQDRGHEGRQTARQFTGSSGISLTGTCTACPAAPATVTANGTATGAFVGSAAQRLVTSFSARAAAQSVSGVGYLAR